MSLISNKEIPVVFINKNLPPFKNNYELTNIGMVATVIKIFNDGRVIVYEDILLI